MRFRDLLLRHIASPYGLTAASLLLFLFAWVFPPGTYSSYLREPDLMFLDPASLLYFLLCASGFLVGLMIVDFCFPVTGFARGRMELRVSPMWFLLLPLIAGTVLTIISIVLLLRSNANLLELLLTAQGGQLKAVGGFETSGTLGLASVALMGIVWWASWRKHQLNLSGWRRFAVQIVTLLATGSMLAAATLKLARGDLMPILAGAGILFVLSEIVEGRLTAASVLRYSAAFVALIVALFVGVSLLRGNVDADSVIGDLFGYTIASYNRMAAILDGRMHYPFAGQGMYISSFAAFNDTFNTLLPLNKLLAWPDFTTAWQSEFASVSTAGLNAGFIWSGTFGYVFSDMGWMSPFLLFAYGLMTGWVWRSLKLGRTAGIVLYPWFAFCILFWFGTNYLLDTKVVVLLVDAVILGLYELLFVRPVAAVS
jgi:hypothetical protein